jgi:hypothetical protein
MNTSTIVHRVWNYCNILRELVPTLLRGDSISYGDYVERRLSVLQEAPYGDDIESVVAASVARASRLRHVSPSGGSVLKSAACPAYGVGGIEGRLVHE